MQISQLSKQSQTSSNKKLLIGMLACSLTGFTIGMGVILTQISPLAISLTDKKTREAYEFGIKWMNLREKRTLEKNK